jgi:acyl-CoA synthetase (AMP-forming)/AMP-acid ligase II
MAALSDIAAIGTLPRLVQAAGDRYGDATAIEEGDFALTFRELSAASLRSARAFIAAGVQPGDRVSIWAPNIHEWILAAVGLQSAGGVLVPLNTRFKAAEANYILAKSGARILCTMGEFLGINYAECLGDGRPTTLERIVTLQGTGSGATPWAEFLQAGDVVSDAVARERALAVEPEDLADIMFTSGTTGRPKGVMSKHAQDLRVYEVWSSLIGLRDSDRYLIINPFFHAFGYKSGWLASIMRGATILPHQVFDVPVVLERVAKERISMLPGTPALFQSILAYPGREAFDLSSLRLSVTGAAAIPVELIERMRDELGFENVVTGYGLTECTGTVSMCRHDDDPETIATTSGCAIPDTEVKCVDSAGVEVARGEPGEVVVRGYNVMSGYFEDQQETQRTIDADGWLRTGDIATMDERGYLKITDRIKDMFIMGGFNCYPAEIENRLFEMQGVAQVAVIGVPDERMGEVGMAFVVQEPAASLGPESVVAWCREQMANYKVPRHGFRNGSNRRWSYGRESAQPSRNDFQQRSGRAPKRCAAGYLIGRSRRWRDDSRARLH